MVPVQGDSRGCLWKGPTCSWGFVKALHRQRNHHHLIWCLGWFLGNQNKHSHYSLSGPGQLCSFPTVFCSEKKKKKKKTGCISILTPLRVSRALSTPSVFVAAAGTLRHFWAMFMHVINRYVRNTACQLLLRESGKFKHSHLSPALWQPCDIPGAADEAYKVILWGDNQKRSWLTNEKVQPRLRISKKK